MTKKIQENEKKKNFPETCQTISLRYLPVCLETYFTICWQDLDEVRIGILKHLADFLKLLEEKERHSYLPQLAEFLKMDNERNWRFRLGIALIKKKDYKIKFGQGDTSANNVFLFISFFFLR
jgi:hypothetical protein